MRLDLRLGKNHQLSKYYGPAKIDVILHYLPKERYIVRNLLLH